MELICAVQKYHWGKTGNNSVVAKLAKANSKTVINENEKYAEFWMGSHPNGSSILKSSHQTLLEHIRLHPEDLGVNVLQEFGNQLPFLFKVLSIEEPLSIQAHPTKALAEKLFIEYPNIYKDKNHKPEIAIALTKFEALCGFRPKPQLLKFLTDIKEFELLIHTSKLESLKQALAFDKNDEELNKLLRECFQCLLLNEKEVIIEATGKLISHLEKLEMQDKEKFHYDLVMKLNSYFPNDIGIFCIYWLNCLSLLPGEALYLAPNQPHAYIHGDCIECMANSDNVVRAGLTPKYRDIETLCDMLNYQTHEPSEILFKPIKEDQFSILYKPPVRDFAVSKIELPKNYSYTLKKRGSASIVLILEGFGHLKSNVAEFGRVFFIPAHNDIEIKSQGIILYQAFCNINDA